MNTGYVLINLILIATIVVVIVMVIKKLVSVWLRDEARKIVGGIALFVGGVLTLYGISSINSAGSQFASAMDKPNLSGAIAIGIGVMIGIIGIVILLSKSRSSSASHASTTMKCPFCAKTIQAEAKLCRFCGKTLETSSTNQL